jgi:hypothetical protein
MPIGSIHVMDSAQPIEIVTCDDALGVGVFSIQESLPPWPAESITEEIVAGDDLEELVLPNRHYKNGPWASHEVVAIEQDFPYQTADGADLLVADTVWIEGRSAGNPGSLLLKDGKLAAVFLDNGGLPLKCYAMPASVLFERCQELVARTDQGSDVEMPAGPP